MEPDELESGQVSPETRASHISVSQLLKDIETAEQVPGDPNEVIEGATRGELLEAGFAFLNVYGDGEKPLINTVIDGVDLGKLKLLTAEQLESVIEYQRAHPEEYGQGEQTLEDLRLDMLSFLLYSEATNLGGGPFDYRAQAAHFALVGNHRLEFSLRDREKDLANAKRYFEFLKAPYKTRYEHKAESLTEPDRSYHLREASDNANLDASRQFMEEHASDIYPWKGGEFFRPPQVRDRNVQVGIYTGRIGALVGKPSPFLDSGYHFGDNIDATIDLDDGRQARLNSLSFHLFSRGISEMGDGQGMDQHYLTLGEYEDLLFPNDPARRAEIHAQEERDINIARQYQEPATREEGEIQRQEMQARILERFVQVANKWAADELIEGESNI